MYVKDASSERRLDGGSEISIFGSVMRILVEVGYSSNRSAGYHYDCYVRSCQLEELLTGDGSR